MFAAGCTTGYLDAKNQDIIDPSNVTSVTGLPSLYNGAKSDFAYANAGDQGNQEGQILTSGMLADEILNSDTFPTRIEEDRRATRINNVTNEYVFRIAQRARVSADLTAAAYVKLIKDGSANANLSEMYSLSGLATVALAENYCGNVPLGSFTPDSIVGGPGQTTTQLLTVAVAKFDSALAAVPGDNLASVGKARALVDLGQYAAAATAVAAVPVSFKYQESHAALPARIVNGVYSFFVESIRFSMADVEGGTGLDFISAGDPRVGSEDTGGLGFDNTTPQINETKYATRADPITVADGIEAGLIKAEAFLAAGNTTSYLSTLNSLRTTVPGLAPLTLPATAAARVDQLFRERAFWLYLTGHRLGDLRRLIRQYGRGIETVFPTGAFHKLGLNYGTAVSLPVPQAEQNNLQYDATKCDTNVP
jgi:hypothetical protein